MTHGCSSGPSSTQIEVQWSPISSSCTTLREKDAGS